MKLNKYYYFLINFINQLKYKEGILVKTNN